MSRDEAINSNPALSEPASPAPDALAPTESKYIVVDWITSQLVAHNIPDPGPPPDGGLQAWTQVVCAWLAIANTWGFVISFGAFQTFYATILPQSPSTISWIGSIQAWFLFAIGIFSGRALDAGLFRPVVLLGITVQLVGVFTMSVSKTYWQLFLAQGVCTGVGGGLFFVPIMGLCSTYFAKKRGLALALVTSGNSAGGMIYPLVVRQLLGKVGFAWTVRVLGFINFISLAVVMALMKSRLPPRKSGRLVDLDAFKDVPYILNILGMCFLLAPVYFVFYYVASFAHDTLSISYTTSLNLVMIINGVGIPARILVGFLADRYFGILNTYFLCLLANIIILWSWLAVSSMPSYYAFTVLYGIISAAWQSLFPTTIAVLSSDISKTGTRMGMAFTTIGFAALVGGPIGGALLKAGDGWYGAPVCWAGASTIMGTALVGAARGLKWGWRWRTVC